MRSIRPRAHVQGRRQSRIRRQASQRIAERIDADGRRILALLCGGWSTGEVARELALDADYVAGFLSGLAQSLVTEHVIGGPSLDAIKAWATEAGLL